MQLGFETLRMKGLKSATHAQKYMANKESLKY